MEEQAPRDPGTRKDRRTTHGHTGITALRLVTLAACLALTLMLATAPPREAPRVGSIGAGCSYELDEWSTEGQYFIGQTIYQRSKTPIIFKSSML